MLDTLIYAIGVTVVITTGLAVTATALFVATNELWRRCREAYDLLLVRRVLKRLHRRRMLLTTRDRRAP